MKRKVLLDFVNDASDLREHGLIASKAWSNQNAMYALQQRGHVIDRFVLNTCGDLMLLHFRRGTQCWMNYQLGAVRLNGNASVARAHHMGDIDS